MVGVERVVLLLMCPPARKGGWGGWGGGRHALINRISTICYVVTTRRHTLTSRTSRDRFARIMFNMTSNTSTRRRRQTSIPHSPSEAQGSNRKGTSLSQDVGGFSLWRCRFASPLARHVFFIMIRAYFICVSHVVCTFPVDN